MNDFNECNALEEMNDNFALANTTIKSQAYGQVTTKEVLDHQEHFNEEEKETLGETLSNHKQLFDKKLGHYPH